MTYNGITNCTLFMWLLFKTVIYQVTGVALNNLKRYWEVFKL